MKAFNLLQMLTKGLIPVENCITFTFDTSDLYELVSQFGSEFVWYGHMKAGHYFGITLKETDDFTVDDWDLMGSPYDGNGGCWYLYHVSE